MSMDNVKDVLLDVRLAQLLLLVLVVKQSTSLWELHAFLLLTIVQNSMQLVHVLPVLKDILSTQAIQVVKMT